MNRKHTNILDRISPFSLLLTMIILMIIGAALIPLVDVGSSPRPRQGKTLTFVRAGLPGVYAYHQEIMLEPAERWA